MTGINQGLGITSYSRNQSNPRKGRPATITSPTTYAAVNPILAQVGTITIGGTASDGDYVVAITDDVTGETVTITVVRSTTPATNAAIATQMKVQIDADDTLRGWLSCSDDLNAVLTLTFLHAGRTYTVATSETTATGTITWASTQTAGGSAISVARFVREGAAEVGGQRTVRALTTTSLADDVIGFVLTPLAEIPNQGSVLAASEDQYAAGAMVNVATTGAVIAENVAGTGAANGYVYVVRSTTGGDEVGEMRASASGVAHVVEAAPTAANSTQYVLNITLVDESTGLDVTSCQVEVTSDASATDAEIVNALKIKVDAERIVTVHGCTSANVSDDLEITAPVGFRLVLVNAGVGTLTVADVTALAMYTIRLPKSRARIDQAIAASGTGRIQLAL